MLSFMWLGNRSLRAPSRQSRRPNRRNQYSMRAVIEAAEPRVLLSGTSYALNTVTTFDGNAGARPYAGVIADSSGNLWGTTYGSNSSDDSGGSVFEIPKGSNTPVLIHQFTGTGSDGDNPQGPLTADPTDPQILYGTTTEGGDNSDGTVFKVDTSNNTVTTLVSFDNPDFQNGDTPEGALAIDSIGNIYGGTYGGGTNDEGTIFKIADGTSTITTLYNFDPSTSGVSPQNGVILVNGILYGTTPGYGGGDTFQDTVFKMDPANPASFATLVDFTNTGQGEDINGLTADSSGNLYGSLSFGGTDGNIFEIQAGASEATILTTLGAADGSATFPIGTLTVGPDGNLYGLSHGGGVNDNGAIFEVDHTTHQVSTIASLDANTTGSNSDDVQVKLLFVGNNIYGTASDEGNNTNGFGTVFELTPSGPPAKLVFLQQPGNDIARNSLSGDVTVKVEDSFGNIIQNDTSTVTLSVASPTGAAFQAGSVATAQAVSGIATFDFLVLNKADTYTLSATDTDAGAVLTPASSNSFTISHASADHVAFVTQPPNGVQAVALSPAIVVNIDDAYGNLVTNSGAAVTLGIATGGPAGAGISGNVIAANNGVATFNGLTLADAGIYTLSASSAGLTSAASNPFTINGPFGPAAKIIFTDSPANTTAGSTLTDGQNHTISLQVQDANGTLVTTDNSTITLALSPTATLNGTTTVHVVNGVASFGDLSVPTAGTYTLVATDGSLAGASSNSFLISAAAVSQVGLINPPTTSSTGGPTTLTAGAQDQYGNVVTGYTTPITVTANGPAGTTAQSFTLNPTNGEATFTINLTNPGSYSFNLNSGAFTETTVSPITLSYIQPTLVFTSPINGQIVAGDKIAPITLTLYNADGVITNAKPKVTLGFYSSPAGAKLYGRTTAKGKNGQVTFKNLKIRQAATGYVMEASATGFGTGLTNTFQVVPNAAKKMAFTAQPSGVTHGSPFNVGVQLFDKYGNLCTNNTSTVTLSVSPKKATINGLLSTTPINGLAEFTGLSFDSAGKYSLKAADSAKGVGKASTKKFAVN